MVIKIIDVCPCLPINYIYIGEVYGHIYWVLLKTTVSAFPAGYTTAVRPGGEYSHGGF
jgi:hypothetical protein